MSRKPSYKELFQKNTELESALVKAQHLEQKLRHSERRLLEIIDFLPDAMFTVDIEGKVTAWNRAIEELTGVKSEDMLGKGDYEYAIPFYGVRRPVLIDLVLNWDEESGNKYDYVKRQENILSSETSNPPFRESPSHFWNSASPLYDALGNVVGAIEVIRDITDIKRTHEEVKGREQLLQTFIANTPTPTAMFDLDMCYLAHSRRWKTDYKPPDEDLIGRNHYDVFPEIPDHWKQEHKRVLAGETIRVESELFRFADGREEWIKRELVPWRNAQGKIGGLIIFNELITQRKQAEKALKQANYIINASPAVLFLWENREGWPVEFVTANVKKLFGYSEHEFVSGSICYRDVVYAEDFDRVSNEVTKNSADLSNSEFIHAPYRIVTRQGDVKWVEDKTSIRKDESGNITHYHGIVEDITERKQMEEDLSAEKERLTVTLRSIGDAVITTDRKGRIALMNPIAEDLTGWSEADAIGRQLMDVFRIVNERTGEPCVNPVDKVLSSGQIVDLANHTMLIAKDGQEYIIADSGAPILAQNGELIGIVLVFRDITGQQRIEKELLKMEKLKSLGVLAGGIAHDFNNFLTGIIGNLSLAKLDIQPGTPVSRALDEMGKAAVHAKELTQQLLTFSKGGEPVKHTTSIGNLVRESAKFALHGSNVRCEVNLDEGLLPVDVDEGQIAQVVQNLIINADQAMPNGGAILVQGTNMTLAPGNPYALKPGNHIQLSIQDEGTGIHPEHLKKIFDPYFTTKQKGSGLGLAVAYNIIAKHDGQLTVNSKLGQGTTFTLLLPASESTHVIDTKQTNGLITGHGRILVMDDEDFIRELATVMLQKMGYEVELAPDGLTAIDIYKDALEAGNPFDAVILDLTVPGGMGGKETVQHLTTLDPNVRAIVSSGYSSDPVMANYTNYGFCGAVKKPYLVQEMSQVLNEVIKG